MNVLSLCSGVGGLDLGLKLAAPTARVVAYVEKDAFCQEILQARMRDGCLDLAPIFTDLRQFDAREFAGLVDGVIGGYPCQPFSVAGKQRGAADDRHLWPAVARIMAECHPTWGFFENVGGHLRLGFQDVASDLERLGYGVSAGLFTAAEVGAPHRRQRLFVLAYREGEHGGLLVQRGRQDEAGAELGRGGEGVEDAARLGEQGRGAGRGVCQAGDAVDDPAGPRRNWRLTGSSEAPRDETRGRESGGRRDALGDAECRRLQSWRKQSSSPETEIIATGCGPCLDDTNEPGLEGRGESLGERADSWPAWPPGPTERDRWAAVLARWPDLAPALADSKDPNWRRATNPTDSGWGFEETGGSGGPGSTQPPLRGVVDGLPSRVDRLRALGNAVVPAQAARAILMLLDKL